MEERKPVLTTPRRRPTGRHAWTAKVGRVLLLAVVLGASACQSEADPPPAETAPPLARLRVIFPEGFTRSEMADRVAAVREIAIDERAVTPRLTRSGYLLASAAAVPPPAFRKDWPGGSIEGSSSRRPTSSRS